MAAKIQPFSCDDHDCTGDGDRQSKSTPNEDQGATTLMIRNLPCRVRRHEIVEAIHSRGFADKYDSLNVPQRSMRGRFGFGFISFSSQDLADEFTLAFSGHRFNCSPHSSKLVEIHPARLQGLTENLRRHSEYKQCLAAAFGRDAPSVAMVAKIQPFSCDDHDCTGDGDRQSTSRPNEDQGATMLMIRNLPCRVRRHEIVEAIHSLGFADKYDFLHVPQRARTSSRGSFGYGFINFSSQDLADAFTLAFSGHRFNCSPHSGKLVEIHPARLQGLTNYQRRHSEYKQCLAPRIRNGTPSTEDDLFRGEGGTNLRADGLHDPQQSKGSLSEWNEVLSFFSS